MLRRLIGEDVELFTQLEPELARIKADPSQIEQVILNLAVNARDAMPQGGKLTIRTANVSFDQRTSHRNRNLEPGDYVMLEVRDTGVGMTDKVRAHLFEPFFTTKGPGKGTGLGLATCYGIARQSGGDIRVYSEPSQGTSFKVYLPRVDELPTPRTVSAEPAAVPTGRENLLLVEDEVAVRELLAQILRECGYKVLEASNGREGLRLAEGGAPIDLIISDIIMPQMSGQHMVERIQSKYPRVRVLFTSGYADDALTTPSSLHPGFAFIEKPFSLKHLAQKVREILDQPLPV
jgi:CheY-like chemotaxis protein